LNKVSGVSIGVAAVAVVAAVSSTAVVRHRHALQLRAREQLLRADLQLLRGGIRRYRAEHGALPRALKDVVRVVPADPITGRADTWRLTTEENVTGDDFAPDAKPAHGGGIADVHSGARGTDSEGKAWSEY
jgi:general secretion pathway protein G